MDHDLRPRVLEARLCWPPPPRRLVGFVDRHRCDYGVIASMVGSFYDRVATLGRPGFVNEGEVLRAFGGHRSTCGTRSSPTSPRPGAMGSELFPASGR